jgi:hypothetical protein
MLKLSEVSPIRLPNYFLTDRLSKESLLKICVDSPILKTYLPDSTNLDAIQRDFLITVNFLITVYSLSIPKHLRSFRN